MWLMRGTQVKDKRSRAGWLGVYLSPNTYKLFGSNYSPPSRECGIDLSVASCDSLLFIYRRRSSWWLSNAQSFVFQDNPSLLAILCSLHLSPSPTQDSSVYSLRHASHHAKKPTEQICFRFFTHVPVIIEWSMVLWGVKKR